MKNKFWQRVFFTQISPTIAVGAKRSLQEDDIPSLPPELDPRTPLRRENEIHWTSGPALLKSLILATRELSWIPLMFLMLSAAFSLSGPIIVNHFVTRISAGLDSPQSIWTAIFFGAGIGLCGMLAGLLMQHYFYLHLKREQIVINILNKKIFKHALCLTKEAREQIPVGDMVNHLSGDTDSVAEAFGALSDFAYCMTMLSGAIAMLFYYLGSTAWIGMILLLGLLPLTRLVGRQFTRYNEELSHQRDRRISLMSQILNAIRPVKYFTWEQAVIKEVGAIREDEFSARRRLARAELVVTLLYVSIGTLVLFFVLSLHSWRGEILSPALVFTCVSLFALLEDPFAYLSRVLSIFVRARVGAARISKFLEQPTIGGAAAPQVESKTLGIESKSLCVHLGKSRFPALQDINLQVRTGQSLAIIGPVGGGKSTFLQALLKEVQPSSGNLAFVDAGGVQQTQCKLGYAPQEAFILNSTIFANLAFGRKDIADSEIERALFLADLLDDVHRLEGGLFTEIGERGINLSGGQKQRLSLARVILHQPQMVLLDDPLSAVDPATEHHIVNSLIFGEWNSITRIVITHRLTHLHRFDQIAFLENGRVIDAGTFSELEQRCSRFRSYIEETQCSQSIAERRPSRTESMNLITQEGQGTRFTHDEDRAIGAVRKGVYFDYILALCGPHPRWRPIVLAALLVAAASSTLLPLMQKAWLAFISNIQSGSTPHNALTWLTDLARHPTMAVIVYGSLGLVVLIGALAADLFWLGRGLKAGRKIHEGMLNSILGTRIRFFDSTPVGRILQRFSRDMEAIDIQLQWTIENSLKCFAQVIITLILIVGALPILGLFIIPVMVIYYLIQARYRASAREVKRLDSISRSPRYAHFRETLQGLVVMRAFDRTQWFLSEFFDRLAHSQRMFHGHVLVNRWFSSRIPIIGGLISMMTAIAVVFAVSKNSLSPGMAGLLTVYSLSFWAVLNWGVRIWAEVEARMTSMERVKTYSMLQQEPLTTAPVMQSQQWPTQGTIAFENVTARYAPGLPIILKNLSFQVPAGSKVGVIGRTGSGKSTLFQALYRLIELDSGKISIDGVDICTVPLPLLRRALAIIPQDPTLFMGTIRSNLDRHCEFTDDEIWSVLERTCLNEMVFNLPEQLESPLTENGANLSQGQRQLMCLARALLLKAKVIILDEATASVDVQTDTQVQRVLREASENVTMLIIAHRLGTVRDCDLILELSEGTLVTTPQSVASYLDASPPGLDRLE